MSRCEAIAAAAVLACALARAQTQTPPAPASASAPAEASQAATYVGSQMCGACHEEIYNNFFKQNPHRSVEKQAWRGFENNACESCHGPGSKHVETASAAEIRNPAKMPAQQVDRTCLRCHLNEPRHAGRIESSHVKNQVACTSCHFMHQGVEKIVARRNEAVNAQCARCHSPEWASFNRPYHHRLPEGAMSCIDCHNPHGSLLPPMRQTFAANEPGCLKCHADKRGPFTFEHAPVRLEGCWSCHDPHGSANPRMLIRQEVRFVCLQCHANLPLPPSTPSLSTVARNSLGVVPPAFHDLRSPTFQNCTVCHQKIHGSHVNRFFLR